MVYIPVNKSNCCQDMRVLYSKKTFFNEGNKIDLQRGLISCYV